MILTDVIQIYKSMYPVRIGVSAINILFVCRLTKIFRYLMAYVGNFLKRILTYFYCTKYSKINICLSDVQKHVSYTRSHKRFLTYYGLCLEGAGNVFSIVFHRSFLLY